MPNHDGRIFTCCADPGLRRLIERLAEKHRWVVQPCEATLQRLARGDPPMRALQMTGDLSNKGQTKSDRSPRRSGDSMVSAHCRKPRFDGADEDGLLSGCVLLEWTFLRAGRGGAVRAGECVRQLLAVQPLNVVVAAVPGQSVPHAVEAFKSGCREVVELPVRRRPLEEVMHSAMDHYHQLRRRHAELHEIHGRLRLLSQRELEVLEGVKVGKLNKEIAAEMRVVEKTVEHHRANLMQKMEARTLAELIQMLTKLEAWRREQRVSGKP